MDDHLLKLPRFIGLNRRTSQVLSQNISLAWHLGSIVPIGTGGKGAMLRTCRRVCRCCPANCICYDKPERLRFGTIFFSTNF